MGTNALWESTHEGNNLGFICVATAQSWTHELAVPVHRFRF